MSEMSKSERYLLTENNITTVETGKFICSSCNCPISGIKSVRQHIQGYLHQNIIQFKTMDATSRKQIVNRNNRSQHNPFTVNKGNTNANCKPPTNKQRQKLPNSQPILKSNNLAHLNITSKKHFICGLCHMDCNSETELQQHLESSSTLFQHEPNKSKSKSISMNHLSITKVTSNLSDDSSDDSDIWFFNKFLENTKVIKPARVTTSTEALKQSNQLQNGVKKQETKNQTRSQTTSQTQTNVYVQEIEKQQKKDHLNKNVMELELSCVSKMASGQIQNGVKKLESTGSVNQQKKNHKNTKLTKLEESNCFTKKAASKVQNGVEGQGKVAKSTEAQKQSGEIQNGVEKQETKNQTKPDENPLLNQIYQISKKNKDENLLFLYDMLFLSSGKLNIFNPTHLQKLMDCFWVTFVRNDTINCMICAKQIANDANKLYDHVRSSEHEQNTKSILENHEQFAEFPDQFSDLRLAKELMCEVSDDEIDCFVCVTRLQNTDTEIDWHLRTAKHKTTRAEMLNTMMEMGQNLINTFQGNWYHVDHYSCEICGKNFISEIKFFSHLNSVGHKQKLSTETKCCYDFCIPCSCLWYGQENSCEEHLQNHKHEFNLTTERYLIREMPVRARKALQDVEGFAEKVVRFTEREDFNVVELTMSDLRESTQKKGVVPLSEIDLEQLPGFVDSTLIANDRGSFEENFKLVDMLCKTQKWLQLHPQKETHSFMMFNTKYAFQCQLIFDNTLLITTRQIWCYFIIFNTCKRTMFFLQHWLTFCNFDLNQISCSVLVWLVIFYYQNVHDYPSMQQIISCDTSILDVERPIISLRDDLEGFFKFYSTFDFKTLILSPLLGKAVKKIDYFSLKQNEEWRFTLHSPVVLENPAKQGTINLTQSMTKLTLRTFRHYCAESLKLLS